ncbi:MAG: hypothetical protein ACN6N0_01020, partial [Microvirgula sp.]
MKLKTTHTIALLAIALASPWSMAASVLSFSPQNEVREIQQVRATFSAPMIRMGNVSAPAPFDIDCAQKGNGHWIDD